MGTVFRLNLISSKKKKMFDAKIGLYYSLHGQLMSIESTVNILKRMQ